MAFVDTSKVDVAVVKKMCDRAMYAYRGSGAPTQFTDNLLEIARELVSLSANPEDLKQDAFLMKCDLGILTHGCAT